MRMSEVHADVERFVQPLPLDEFTQQVSQHLHLIEAGAEMAARHAKMMLQRPDFETKAQGELSRAEVVLTRALDKIREAKSQYVGKPVERSDAF